MSNPLLLLLAVANFAVGMGAFGVIGLLVPVGEAFTLTPSEAAWMMSLYAIVYAFASPVLVATTGALDRARVLVAGMLVFGLGAIMAALAPDYPMLLAARALMALGGGLVTPVGASIGVAAMPPEHRGRALAVVFGGLTLAQAVGVPACAWLGYALGWRSAFALVAVLTLVAGLLLYRQVPRGLAVPRTTLGSLGTVLASPRLVGAVGFTALFLGGAYVLFTFLAPFATARYGLGRDGVTALLLLFGLGAVVGNALGGFLTDRIGPVRALVLLSVAQAMLLLPITLLPFPEEALFGLVALWSAACWAFMVPQQARLAAMAPPLTPVLFALNAAAIYIGGSIGSASGGFALRHLGFEALGPTGAVLVLAALLSLALVARQAPAKAATSPKGTTGMPETRFVETAGQRMAFTRQGSGPPVVIVHGIGGRKEDWFGVSAALAARHTVLTVDMIGFGESSKDSAALTIGMQADALNALLTAEGFATADIVGNSLGGWVAAVFASRFPQRARRLVMIDAAGLKVTLSGPPPVNFAPDSVAEMQALLRTVIESPFAHTTEFAEQALAGFRASGVAASLGKLFAGFADPASTDRPLDDVLPGVAAPTLVMWGASDRLFPAALADMVVAGLPGARKVLIPDAGHFPHIDNQAAVVTELEGFLA